MKQVSTYCVSLAVSCAVLALCSCADESRSIAPAPERAYNVETTLATTADIRITVDAVGTVQASEEAELRPQADGLVAEILFDEASRVHRGDLLVRLDDRKAAARLALAKAVLDSTKAKLALARQRLHRQSELLEDELVSAEDFDTATAEELAAAASVREQQAAVALAERELEDYYIRAPFAGVIGERLVDIGNYVERGALLAVVMKVDPIHIVFKVADRYATTILPGIPVTIATAAGGNAVDASITFVDPRIDPNTRMLTVRATAANEDGRLRPGQFVEVSALLEVHEHQVVIPEEAVLSEAGRTWAYVVEDAVARRRELGLGERRPPLVEVISGISAGETLVVGGQHRLSDGSHVAVQEVIPSGPAG
ncbi:MAG: efflux RND transporter periplasmic adaptor subunit [Candidatus Binatia bacterium]